MQRANRLVSTPYVFFFSKKGWAWEVPVNDDRVRKATPPPSFRPRSERTELANAWDHADDLRPEELGAFHIQPPALLRG